MRAKSATAATRDGTTVRCCSTKGRQRTSSHDHCSISTVGCASPAIALWSDGPVPSR